MVGYGKAVWDISYFLSLSTNCKDFQYHRRLLQCYQKELHKCRLSKSANSGEMPDEYTLKELEHDCWYHLCCNIIFFSNQNAVDLVKLKNEDLERDRDEKGKTVISAKYHFIKQTLTRLVFMVNAGVLDSM